MALKHIATIVTLTLASGFALSAHAGVKSPPTAANKTESSYMVDKPDMPPKIKPSVKRDSQSAETNRSSPSAPRLPR